jgi:nicotinate-nucleotide adenylyltransferase
MLMPNSSTKTGLFFGSFNPMHNGHMIIADYMLDQEGLDEIWFIVSPQNPLKESKQLANEQQRLEMMNLAVASEPRFKVSDVEFAMPKPSYTFDTLELLSRVYPERNFFLIIGSDNLEEFHLWKNHEQILKKYQILVYPRNEEINSSFVKEPNVKITQAPLVEISSTKIRKLLKSGRSVDSYIPSRISKYITVNGLYRV